jgi:hypothetical protein
MITAVLNCQHYKVANESFPCACIDDGQLVGLLENSQLEISLHETIEATPPRGYDAITAICAIKRTQSNKSVLPKNRRIAAPGPEVAAPKGRSTYHPAVPTGESNGRSTNELSAREGERASGSGQQANLRGANGGIGES